MKNFRNLEAEFSPGEHEKRKKRFKALGWHPLNL